MPRPFRVLVADDDPVILALLCGVLRQQGWLALPAVDAPQVQMHALRAPAPDVILLDINMPGGTGIAALERLKRSTKTMQIPVAVITGSEDPDLPARVQALGAAAFIAKPIDPAQVVEVIGQIAAVPA